METPIISFDTKAWEHSLAQLSVATSAGMKEVLNEEWPLLMRKIEDFTPPKTLAQGRAAVASDIEKTMRPFDPQSVRSAALRAVIEKRDIEAFNIVAARAKKAPMRNAKAVAFAPSVHTSARDSRGRVRTDRASNTVVLGHDAALLKKYKTDVQSRVGWAKAGWLPAIQLLGATVQSFVSKHAPGSGAVIDKREDKDSPSITGINRTPWAGRRDEAHRIVQDAIYSRSVAVFAKVKAKLRLAAKNSGFDTK